MKYAIILIDSFNMILCEAEPDELAKIIQPKGSGLKISKILDSRLEETEWKVLDNCYVDIRHGKVYKSVPQTAKLYDQEDQARKDFK